MINIGISGLPGDPKKKQDAKKAANSKRIKQQKQERIKQEQQQSYVPENINNVEGLDYVTEENSGGIQWNKK
ncbi:MAG: hypothetical protein H8D97_00800 [Proteobacteria bacterium]|nr:hypothetical protein [Pseudomonadota bacterium]